MIQTNLLKILFVEDVPSDVDLAVLELRKENLKFEYTTVCTRIDLVKALKEFNPNLIISDYMMPVFNGLQALKETKAFDPDIPFILYTGSVNEETAVECIKAGANDYVIKEHSTRLPFAVKEVLEQVIINKEKRASELLLRENEEKLQSIFSAAPVGIGLVVNRVLIEVNDFFCGMTGYARSELIGKSSEILYPSKDEFISAGKEIYQQISKKGIGSVETKFKRKDGKILNVILSSAPLDKNDHLKGVTFTVLDITSNKIAENSLKESEERFRTLYNSAVLGLFRTNSEGEILQANEALVKMLGFQSFKELATRNLNKSGFRPSYRRQNFIDQIEKEGEIIDLEEIWIRSDGKELFVRENAKAISDSDGKILYYDGSVEDITQRKIAEEALRKSQQLFETLALTSPVGIFRTNSDGYTTYVNSKWMELSGLTSDEAIGFGWLKAVHPDDRKHLEGKWKSDVQTRQESSVEYRFLKQDGTICWVMGNAVPDLIDNNLAGYIGTITDITEWKQSEIALKESEEKYRRIFENVQDVYYETSVDGKILEVSPSIEILSDGNYKMEDLIGKSMNDFYLDTKERQIIIATLREKGFVKDFEITLKKQEGLNTPCSISAKLILDPNGFPEKIIGSIHDITDRKNASDALKLAKEKAEMSDRLKTDFLNNISHEVRTPLNGILGFAEIISIKDLTEEEKKESLAMLFESSNRLLNTITNYMDISLITSGSLSVNKKDFIPALILRKIFNNFEPACLTRRLELLLEIPEQYDNYFINSDPEICQKIISHFLDNAIKFTHKGKIHFGFNFKYDQLEFFVKDTGIGINSDSFKIIFERFAKESSGSYKVTEGSGLGLAIAQGMSEAIGGKIRLESEPGIGSCFYLAVPAKKVDEVSSHGNPLKASRTTIEGSMILIAEDDETNFYFLNALIKRETDAKVLHASNGREAIDLFKANPGIKLILMDIKMPEIDGLEATRQIKLINRNIHIIAITAYAMSGDEEKIIAAGCDGYLSKPINKISLLEKISEFVLIK